MKRLNNSRVINSLMSNYELWISKYDIIYEKREKIQGIMEQLSRQIDSLKYELEKINKYPSEGCGEQIRNRNDAHSRYYRATEEYTELREIQVSYTEKLKACISIEDITAQKAIEEIIYKTDSYSKVYSIYQNLFLHSTVWKEKKKKYFSIEKNPRHWMHHYYGSMNSHWAILALVTSHDAEKWIDEPYEELAFNVKMGFVKDPVASLMLPACRILGANNV